MKNIAWYQVETARSFEKRRHHASLVGEQNDLQTREIIDSQSAKELKAAKKSALMAENKFEATKELW